MRAISILLVTALSAALIACGSGKSAAEDAGGERNGAAQTAVTSGDVSEAGGRTAAAGEAVGTDDTGAAGEVIDIPETPYARDDGGISMDVFAMDTYMNLLAYGDRAEEAVLAAAEEIHRIDDLLSTGNPDSEISKLNAAGSGAVSDDTVRLIEESLALYEETGGLFDIAIYPVMRLWGFPTEQYRVPAEEEISAALKLADASKIIIGGSAAPAQTSGTDKNVPAGAEAAAETAEGSTAAGQAAEGSTAAELAADGSPKTRVTLGISGMEIDLGGIAKGYTGSRVMEIFRECGIEHGLISLGGNVQALGAKENGKAWRVAIRDPESDLDYLGVLEIKDKCVITSGGYERFFLQDGVRYHHIIDPRTGRPADTGIVSATIISEDGTLADGLSTSLFIMGKERAEKFWRGNADRFEYVLEDADGRLYVTEGAAGMITTEAEVEVVKR